MGGVLALLQYVEAFNAERFELPSDTEWRSLTTFWPERYDENDINLFGYSILANVRRALKAMAVQS